MCGIVGVAYVDKSQVIDRQRLSAMSNAISHRGPDGEGLLVLPGIGLAHRRLSIIDLEGGRQPLSNEDGSIHVVFNGEIYNYRELRRVLEGKGHRFATDSDTETLVHLYEEHGESLVDHLRGMFAFALWDQRKSKLILARDRVGIKPLYYYFDAEKLVFASELKGLLAHGGISREINLESLDEYFAYGMVTGAKSIFRDIHKLLPGHVLAIDAARWRNAPQRFWRLRFGPDRSHSVDQWSQLVRSKVEEATTCHLISDVPVGTFLSGGIDSTVITAIAAQKSDRPIKTFSIGFSDDNFNELPFARAVSKLYHTDHVEEIVSPDAALLLDQLCWHYDEPFADTSAIPTMLVSRLAAKHVKVVLSGDGGDEAFGGYARYQHDLAEAAIRKRLPSWLRRGVLGPLANHWPPSSRLPRWLRAKNTFTNLSLDESAAYSNTVATCRLPLRHSLLSGDVVNVLRKHPADNAIEKAYANANGDSLSGMIASDVATLLPDDYLVKVDRASMAYGLEVRPPLLDHELLELAATIPSEWKIREGSTKYILKRATADLIPPELMNRPKQGFEVPVNSWMSGPLVEQFRSSVLDKQGELESILNIANIERLLESHIKGGVKAGQTLWSIMVFAHWHMRFMNGDLLFTPYPRSM